MRDTDPYLLIGLRKIRLYHWREVLRWRKRAETLTLFQIHGAARHAHREASTHLGFVQSLNDFFPIGDTAEHDDAK